MSTQSTGFSGTRLLLLLGAVLLIGVAWYGGRVTVFANGSPMGGMGQMMGEPDTGETATHCPMHARMHGEARTQPDGEIDANGAGDRTLDARTEQWLEGTRGLESIEDRTGESEVVVDVGAGNGLTYAPAAVRVDPGTTIRWVWTGNGGLHDVAFVNADVSGSLRGEQGAEYTYTFAEPGEYRYECTPHASVGMRGLVIVEEN